MGIWLSDIIAEADILVPNAYTTADKAAWLNAINHEFFDVVKIPKTLTFTSYKGITVYNFTGLIKEKDIDKVMFGNQKYRSLSYEDVQPGQNYFTYLEEGKILTLSSAPSQSNITGIVRYRLSAKSTYTAGFVTVQTPDAPDEYHWIYALGLAEYIAKANEESEKAANYGGQYRNALQVAAQNYQKEGAT